jgi:hypothetical protein
VKSKLWITPASNSEARAGTGNRERNQVEETRHSEVKKRGVIGSPMRPKRNPRSRRKKGVSTQKGQNMNMEAEKKEDGQE